jgi:hypothetical protein
MDEIVNRVAQSPLITLNLEEYYHTGERVVWDMKNWLFQEMILREKDFRAALKEHDWAQYENKNVAMLCSVDAIVPTWGYMLAATYLKPHAHRVVMGDLNALELTLYHDALAAIDPTEFTDKKIVIKGCGKFPVPESAYVELTLLLQPYVSSLMYGEPCSTVPLYKKPKR